MAYLSLKGLSGGGSTNGQSYYLYRGYSYVEDPTQYDITLGAGSAINQTEGYWSLASNAPVTTLNGLNIDIKAPSRVTFYFKLAQIYSILDSFKFYVNGQLVKTFAKPIPFEYNLFSFSVDVEANTNINSVGMSVSRGGNGAVYCWVQDILLIER